MTRSYRTSPQPWSVDDDETLRTLWAQGVPARQIARALGEGRSHNAVVGRAARLGLRRRLSPIPEIAERQRERAAQAMRDAERRAAINDQYRRDLLRG